VRADFQSGPLSRAEPYRDIIVSGLDRGLSAQRIWQDLMTDHGFTGGYDSVKRFCRRLRHSTPLPFRRIECLPGEEAQIDFGTGAPIVIERPGSSAEHTGLLSCSEPLSRPGRPSEGSPGKAKPRRRRTHVFRIVLSHSRKAYSESVDRQTTENFIRCLENAFHHFGGVPQTLVIDNLKAAVTRADWFDPELNPKIQAFAAHYGTVILPTKPRTPRHKGKVERGVDYVQENGLRGRTFPSLEAQNRFLREWETRVADTRIHGTTREQVQKAFERERSALLPLPLERFPLFCEGQRKVSRDGHVEVDKAYYSVPPEYLGRSVWVRWDSRLVRIMNNRFEQIAIHTRYAEEDFEGPTRGAVDRRTRSRFITSNDHIPHAKRSGVEQGAAHLLGKIRQIGPQSGEWAQQLIHQRGIEGVRVLMGLLSLAKRHPAGQIEQACAIATTHGAYRLRTIRQLLKRQGDRQERFAFVEVHPIIRSLREYGELIYTSFWRNPDDEEFVANRFEEAAVVGPGGVARHPPAGGRRPRTQPCRVPGVDPSGRTGHPVESADGSPDQGGGVPRLQDDRGLRLRVQSVGEEEAGV
jgi:transposase